MRRPGTKVNVAVSRLSSLPWRLLPWTAAFLAAYQGQSLLAEGSLSYGLAFMCAAALLIAGATWSLRFENEAPRTNDNATLREKVQPLAAPLALLLVALGLGISFRIYELNSLPFGLWHDEAQNGIFADRILRGDWPVFFDDPGTNRPALPVYFLAVGVKVIGHQILALRAVSTVAGIGTLVALFFLARELFGWRVGALAVFFLAVMSWHLNFSRIAMSPIWGPFFAVASMYFLVRGVRTGRWYDFGLGGLLLGVGLQIYWAVLLVPLLFAVYALHSFLTRQSVPFRNLAAGAAIVLGIGVLAYSPLAIYGIQHPGSYTERASSVSITTDKDLRETIAAVQRNTKKHVLMFHAVGDSNSRHNLAGSPMLDPFTGALLVLGIAISLVRIGQPRYLLAVAWLVVLLQPAIWSQEFEAPQALRSILVTPTIAMLAAMPVAALWSMAADADEEQAEEDER